MNEYGGKYVGIFSHPDLKKPESAAVKEGGVKRTDVQRFLAELLKNIVGPLETLKQNRPGNKNNEEGLQTALTLCNKIKDVVALEPTVTTTSTDDVSSHSSNSGP